MYTGIHTRPERSVVDSGRGRRCTRVCKGRESSICNERDRDNGHSKTQEVVGLAMCRSNQESQSERAGA